MSMEAQDSTLKIAFAAIHPKNEDIIEEVTDRCGDLVEINSSGSFEDEDQVMSMGKVIR